MPGPALNPPRENVHWDTHPQMQTQSHLVLEREGGWGKLLQGVGLWTRTSVASPCAHNDGHASWFHLSQHEIVPTRATQVSQHLHIHSTDLTQLNNTSRTESIRHTLRSLATLTRSCASCMLAGRQCIISQARDVACLLCNHDRCARATHQFCAERNERGKRHKSH